MNIIFTLLPTSSKGATINIYNLNLTDMESCLHLIQISTQKNTHILSHMLYKIISHSHISTVAQIHIT